ncbi:MAG: HypC/HybG/HupF family hydrogenase formation chaperone [Firmicutes bacterium]|nr:HypC/HybG/HupF family hydrogenase formation chaperone [Bacillota bacterium]
MCLAVPSKIVSIDEGGFTADVDVLGNIKKVGIILVPNASVGNWVLVHAGQAISVVSEEEASASLETWEEVLRDYEA